MAVDTTLRRDLESTSLKPTLKTIRCSGVLPKNQLPCNKLLFKLHGTAQVTCPRCGTTGYYSSERTAP